MSGDSTAHHSPFIVHHLFRIRRLQCKHHVQQGQRTYFMQLSQQQSAQNQNDPLPNLRTGVQRDRSQDKQPIVSVRHHRQAAHPNSSSKAHAILLTKRIMHVKLLAYILNSVWFHYVSAHSSSSHSPSSYSFSSSLSLASASMPQEQVCKTFIFLHTCFM